jgi:hypothetical protein
MSDAAHKKTKDASRAEQIKRDIEAWRARNPGRDLGREL